MNEDAIFIADEFTWMLTKEDLQLQGEALRLPPIFRLGLEKRVIMVSGHQSQSFDDFLRVRYPSLKINAHGSLQQLAGSNVQTNLVCVGCKNRNPTEEALLRVEELAQSGNSVIVFHPQPEKLRRLKVKSHVVVEVAVTDTRVC